MSSRTVALAPLTNTTNRGVAKYMKTANNYAINDNGMKRLQARLNSTNKSGFANTADWETIKLMLVLEPVLSYLISKVIVIGKRKILNMTKNRAPTTMTNTRAPTPMNTTHSGLLAITGNSSLSPHLNTNTRGINFINAIRRTARANANANAKQVAVIQNAIHMIIFGLITAHGTIETIQSYMQITTLNAGSVQDDFFDVCYDAIILLSRVVFPIILGLINRLFKKSSTGTKAIVLSSAAAVLATTKLDVRALNSMKNTVMSIEALFVTATRKTGVLTRAAQLMDPSITNKKKQALGLGIIATRDTLATIMKLIGKLITASLAVNKGAEVVATRRAAIRPASTNSNSNSRRRITP